MGRSVILLLIGACLGSAFAVVYSTHQSRKLFVEWQSLQNVRDGLDVEWGRLQLEQSTWATHGRIEQTAGAKLGMRLPEPGGVTIVKP
jgi:cell division protein FtsL